MLKKIKKYLPDILFLIGVYVLFSSRYKIEVPFLENFSYKESEVVGIVLVALSFVIILRRYLGNKINKP